MKYACIGRITRSSRKYSMFPKSMLIGCVHETTEFYGLAGYKTILYSIYWQEGSPKNGNAPSEIS